MWVVLMPVVMLTALSHSVPWLNWESLFANAASCGTAWVAALSYFRARRVDEAQLHSRLDDHREALQRIEERSLARLSPDDRTMVGEIESAIAHQTDHLGDAIAMQFQRILDAVGVPAGEEASQ